MSVFCFIIFIVALEFPFRYRAQAHMYAFLSDILPQLTHEEYDDHYYDHETTVEESKYASDATRLTAEQEPQFVARKEGMLLPTQEDSLVGEKEDMIMPEHTDTLTPEEENAIRSLVVIEAPAATTEAKQAVSDETLPVSTEAKQAVSDETLTEVKQAVSDETLPAPTEVKQAVPDKPLPRMTFTPKTSPRKKKRAETARQRTSRVCYEANQMAGE